MANFFIDRPIFAWVLAIILCLTGALAISSLPVEQYPNLAPPNVRISATYPVLRRKRWKTPLPKSLNRI